MSLYPPTSTLLPQLESPLSQSSPFIWCCRRRWARTRTLLYDATSESLALYGRGRKGSMGKTSSFPPSAYNDKTQPYQSSNAAFHQLSTLSMLKMDMVKFSMLCHLVHSYIHQDRHTHFKSVNFDISPPSLSVSHLWHNECILAGW